MGGKRVGIQSWDHGTYFIEDSCGLGQIWRKVYDFLLGHFVYLLAMLL